MMRAKYVAEARKTATYRGGMAYAALGLVGEATEYLADPSIEELSDIAWFVVALADELGTAFDDVVMLSHDTDVSLVRQELAMVCAAGRVAEHVKKWIGSDTPRPRQVIEGLALVYAYLPLLAARTGHSMSEVFDVNIAKLRARQDAGTLLERS